MTIYFGDGSNQTAAASGGLWETAHRQLYTGDNVNDTHLITGLGSYDMLKVYFTVTVTGGAKNKPLPNIQIGTSSGLNTESRYHSSYRSGYSSNYYNIGQLATHWFDNNSPQDLGDPGNDYSAIMVWGDMTIYNWKEDDYYTHGCWFGGYTTTQQNEGGCGAISGAVNHRVKMECDRMQFSWDAAASNNLKKLQVVIQGATYS